MTTNAFMFLESVENMFHLPFSEKQHKSPIVIYITSTITNDFKSVHIINVQQLTSEFLLVLLPWRDVKRLLQSVFIP